MDLQRKIIEEIKYKGFLTIEDFMRICLFDSNFGYYIKNPAVGKQGDFTTAPEISQMFGEVIALYFVQAIKANMECESTDYYEIQIIELGAGNGTLMRDILQIFEKFPDIFKRVSCVIIDVNETLTEKQKQILYQYRGKVSWYKDFEMIGNKPSIIYANEFFDALPISQFEVLGDVWLERVVKFDESQKSFFICLEKTNNCSKQSYQAEKLDNGSILEVNNQSVTIMHQILDYLTLNKGVFLTFDYGYLEQPFTDSLQSLKNHKYNNIFENLGDADLTAYVDFGELVKIAYSKGFENIYFSNQGDFLKSLGIKQRAEILAKKLGLKKINEDLIRLVGKEENQMGEIFKCLLIEKFD